MKGTSFSHVFFNVTSYRLSLYLREKKERRPHPFISLMKRITLCSLLLSSWTSSCTVNLNLKPMSPPTSVLVFLSSIGTTLLFLHFDPSYVYSNFLALLPYPSGSPPTPSFNLSFLSSLASFHSASLSPCCLSFLVSTNC